MGLLPSKKMKQITPESGTTSYDQFFSRNEAGQLLDPPVAERQIRRYLEDLIRFNPQRFSRFSLNDGLNPDEKISNWDIPDLQLFRSLVLEHKNKAKARTIYAQLIKEQTT